MCRVLSIDYGQKRIGLALSDPTRTVATPLKTVLASSDHAQTVRSLTEEISKHDLKMIVIGLPLHLSRQESPLSLLVRELKKRLEEELLTPVTLWDERLTSKQVEKAMIEAGVKRKKRKAHMDTLSATLILQSYLDYDRSL